MKHSPKSDADFIEKIKTIGLITSKACKPAAGPASQDSGHICGIGLAIPVTEPEAKEIVRQLSLKKHDDSAEASFAA